MQTKKLFRVCKMRQMPIFTFVNKLDRPGREPFELVGEVEEVLGIGVYPITWPIFDGGGRFLGVYHRLEKSVFLFEQVAHGAERAPVVRLSLDSPALDELLDPSVRKALMDEARPPRCCR